MGCNEGIGRSQGTVHMAKTSSKQDKSDPAVQIRRRDPEATRAAILDAAEDLFIERGVADSPTSLIAKKAGVTKSLIHHHFGSKEELWSEIKARRFSVYYERQKEVLATSEGSLELLRQSIIAYFQFLQSEPRAVRFMSWRFVEEDDPCLELEEQLFELGVLRIRQAQEKGELRQDLEPLFILKTFLGMAMHWFQSKGIFCRMMGESIEMEDLDERYLEHLLHLYFEGVKPR